MLANNEEVLLLDARSEEEFNTSHLQGALHSDTSQHGIERDQYQ